METTSGGIALHVTLSGDVYLKSRRTQRRLISRVRNNLGDALTSTGVPADVERIGTHRYRIDMDRRDAGAVIEALRRVFGIASIEVVTRVPFVDFEGLVEAVAHATRDRVAGTTFAVRVKRRGTHPWRSPDLARAIGTRLVAAGGTVDLGDPDETVSVSVYDDRAFVVTDHVAGPGGLPLGTQERTMCLMSGGFDSAVAAWMLMSRGSPVDVVHFSMHCAQSDHALAVARELWARWGHGTDPDVHLVEFGPVREALVDGVDSHMRQVTLKVMMARGASAIAAEAGVMAIATGDSLGQVSSQTLPHLTAASSAASVPILRPLVGVAKEDIIGMARRIGTAELSARAREVCDLSDGKPVATAARSRQITRSLDRIPDGVLADAVATRKTFRLSDWRPGQV